MKQQRRRPVTDRDKLVLIIDVLWTAGFDFDGVKRWLARYKSLDDAVKAAVEYKRMLVAGGFANDFGIE